MSSAFFSSSSSSRPQRNGEALNNSMILLGLTGSIGMGKSTVASFLTDMGVPVLDSDAVVHQLYAPGGAAVEPVRNLFGPDVVTPEGSVSRPELGKCVLGDDDAMARLEAVVHPLVDTARWDFLRQAEAASQPLVVFDIPLLYEKGYEATVDAVVVVSAGNPETQRERVLARPGMTPEKFDAILARQVPDDVKRDRADFIIDTGCAVEDTKAAVEALVDNILGRGGGEGEGEGEGTVQGQVQVQAKIYEKMKADRRCY